MTKVKMDSVIPVEFRKKTIEPTEYERLTWGFHNAVSAIERSEKHLRKLERGRKVYGQVVRDERGIAREREKLAAMWDKMRDMSSRVVIVLEHRSDNVCSKAV